MQFINVNVNIFLNRIYSTVYLTQRYYIWKYMRRLNLFTMKIPFNKLAAMLVCTLWCMQIAWAQTDNTTNKVPLSDRITNYDISATYNPDTKIIDGQMTLSWKNTSNDTLYEMQFHTYLNAFKNTQTTFMKERGGNMPWDKKTVSDLNWGWIDVLSIKTKNGLDLTDNATYIQPDDKNENDQTVLRLRMGADTIFPGETVVLEMTFKSKLPKVIARSGWADDYVLVAQWFPKVGVYEHSGIRNVWAGKWNCHQYHSNSEFYADYGVYNVDITLPEDYITGATGLFEKERANTNGTKTVYYKAEDVIDFAWTASPRFRVIEDKHAGILIRLLVQPEHAYQADRYIGSLKIAIDYFNKYLGVFPYPSMTVVDPPIRGQASGGMEYPMLITAGTMWGMPEGIKMAEMVTIHEYGHNYFMALLATNEFEEAWMDEGMNSYYETRIMDENYGDASFVDFMGFRMSDYDMQRGGYVYSSNPRIAESTRNSWQFPAGSYGMLNYNKPATWLNALDRMIGRETMDELMKTYYDRFKFKHPTAKDFIAVANEVVTKKHGDRFGKNLDWFFDQVLMGTHVCDYAVKQVYNRPLTQPGGMYDKKDTRIFVSPEQVGTKFKATVEIQRVGDMQMPIEIMVIFENGEERLEKWDGLGTELKLEFETETKLVSVIIDPDNKLTMDINRSNNSFTLQQDHRAIWKYGVEFLFWLQNLLLVIVSFA